MNMTRIFALTKKELKKTIREPAILFMVILFPLILTVVFGFAFGAIGATETVYDVAVVDKDATAYHWAGYFKGNLSSNEMLNPISYYDLDSARQDLTQGKISAIVYIPENFGNCCQSFWDNPSSPSSWINATIGLYVDSGSMIASQALPPLVQHLLMQTLLGPNAISSSLPVSIGMPALVTSNQFSQFDYMAPGLVAYASIFLVMTVAQTVTSDKEKGLIKRINMTPTTAGDFITSQAVSSMLIASFQTIIVLSLAYLLGFQPGVEFGVYLLAFLMALIFALCNVGFGLITATISKSSSSATGISFLFILPQMFLGTFIPISRDIACFVPSFYITDALTSLFLRGASITSPIVIMDLVVLVIMSFGVFIAGLLLYRKLGNR